MNSFAVPAPPMPPIPWELYSAVAVERGGGNGTCWGGQYPASGGSFQPSNSFFSDAKNSDAFAKEVSLSSSSGNEIATNATPLPTYQTPASPSFPEDLSQPPPYTVVASSSGSESSCSDDAETNTPVVIFDRSNQKDDSKPLNTTSHSKDIDDDAARAVNKAWISMFVQSELRRTEKRKNEEREQKLRDRQPVVSQQAAKRQAAMLLYSKETVDKLTAIESRLHTAYEAKVSAKVPFWPCAPLNVVNTQSGSIKRIKT
eukprot:TRINITY_DN13408_c0_g1_i1.p1 TRINITY_DN13408_c0_g1~~TRINITY_DN13408_c0_g1_i1.p1  ORF type:complete len:258 (+),score=47.43 TRINITY_DN13408_c0_g1_i1:46-819(+)